MLVAALVLLMFASAAALEWFGTINTRATTAGRPLRAALSGLAMYAVSAASLYIWVRVSVWYSAPEALGLFVGSYASVARKRRRS